MVIPASVRAGLETVVVASTQLVKVLEPAATKKATGQKDLIAGINAARQVKANPLIIKRVTAISGVMIDDLVKGPQNLIAS